VNENENRTVLFVALAELSEVIPEMRAGQLVAAVGELCVDLHGRGLWDATDAELLEAVWRFHRNFEAAMVQTSSVKSESAAADGTPEARPQPE
jgi:hypothetical protein